MSTIQNQIAIQLSRLMDEYGVNINALHVLSGVSMKTIHKILNNESKPSINILQKLCNVFCINTCQFFDLIFQDETYMRELLA